MSTKNKAAVILAILLCLNFNPCKASPTQESQNKYPDYAHEYLGKDRCENFNRKMFVFNSKLNKFVLRPVHTVWESVVPKYGAERLQSAYSNIEYPKRLVSSLIQKDFKTSKNETVRFLTNTTIGLGGLYDPAKRFFKIEQSSEDMEQALAKCKVKSGPFLVIPILTTTSPRNIAGRILDTSLNPSSYIATPVAAIVKAGLMVNRTSCLQPLFKMVESTYADPYEIAKKLYGIQGYIQNANLDRTPPPEKTLNVFENETVPKKEENILKVKNLLNTEEEVTLRTDVLKGGAHTDKIILKEKPQDLNADLMLPNYNPQNPVVDSMRTALFDLPGINDSIWNDLSVWNRCFSKKIKTASVKISQGRDDYKFRYILQKAQDSPVAIIYPSIGEGITSYHSVVLAKLFYDKGYSVVIQGSHFQWEFIKSMPEGYKPGIPAEDAKCLRLLTSRILTSLETNHHRKFNGKVILGTSFGAMTTLFLAEQESKENTMDITKYISINPPIELMYAMKQIDNNTREWDKDPLALKHRVAVTAAKVIQVTHMKNAVDSNIQSLPFNEDEAKLITGFIMHQKLSDLIFTIENGSKTKKSDIYQTINNMDYNDYAQKYLLNDKNRTPESLSQEASLYSIADYLQNNDNYKIYHTLDDYLVNTKQLRQLKQYAKDKAVLISNGSHLGFLYRQEFIDELKKDANLK